MITLWYKPFRESYTLLKVKSRLKDDAHFAQITISRRGKNLKDWLPTLSARERSEAYRFARAFYGSPSIWFRALEFLSKIGRPAVEPLIQDLKNENPDVRSRAAKELGRIRDNRAVKPLIAALEASQVLDVQSAAAEALGDIKDARALRPLIAVLTNPKRSNATRSSAAAALGKIGRPAVEPLIAALSDGDRHTQLFAIKALHALNNRRATNALSATLAAGLYRTIVGRGMEHSEPLLMMALERNGSKQMAEDFLNCGNSQLEEAARIWASRRGYQIHNWFGSARVRWGSQE